jgi:hypothetical protein
MVLRLIGFEFDTLLDELMALGVLSGEEVEG